jgi:hypothetical protein
MKFSRIRKLYDMLVEARQAMTFSKKDAENRHA